MGQLIQITGARDWTCIINTHPTAIPDCMSAPETTWALAYANLLLGKIPSTRDSIKMQASMFNEFSRIVGFEVDNLILAHIRPEQLQWLCII